MILLAITAAGLSLSVLIWQIIESRKTNKLIKELNTIKCTLCNSKEITKHEAGYYYCDKH